MLRIARQPLRAALVLATLAAASDGHDCVDTHNQCLEWGWKGECERNAPYMAKSCPLTCSQCSRNATLEVGVDGTAVMEETDALHGDVPDPQRKWTSLIRNPLAAMERTESDGVSVDLYHAASVGPVDVYWLSDGSTRDEGAVGSLMFRLNAGESRRVGTFLGHVFRLADTSGKTLASFRVMPHRPTFHLTDEGIEAYNDEEMCRDSDPSCPDRAARNDCVNAPGWMVMKCSRSCEACHLRDPQVRCRRDLLNVKQTPALTPGGVEAFFQSLLVSQEYNVTIHSRPGGDPDLTKDIADGPWVATLADFVTEEDGRNILATVSSQFARSTDQGSVDKYGEQSKIVSKSRTSENAWCTGHCESHPSTVEVMSRIEKVTGIPTENYESFQVLRYQLGQEYRAHHDMSRTDNRLACGPRVYTFFLYLSDVEEGGETEFPLIKRPSGTTIKVKPTRGTALVWPSVKNDDPTAQDPRTRHAALPVIKGTKFAANAWIHQFDYSEPNIWGCTGAFD